MSGREAAKLLNALDRAKARKRDQRLLRMVKRARYSGGDGFKGIQGSDENIAYYGSSARSAYPMQRLHRYTNSYYGKGGYWMQKLFGAKQGSLLDRAGDFVADKLLPMAGSIGAAASKAINVGGSIASRYLPVSGAGMYRGAGSYAPASNALMDIGADTSGASMVPVVQSTGSGDGSVVIKHKEYVSDVYGPSVPGTFDNVAVTVNPGLEKSFPWLSQVASNFTEYTLHQCVYTYKSAIAPIGASLTGQVGSLIMAAQYDVSDAPFANKQQMLLESGSCADMLTKDMVFGIECDPSKLSGAIGKYIRSAPVVIGSDIKTYDHAVLNIATDAIPAGYVNQAVGELWVEYTVELRKPRLFTGAGDAISRDVYAQPSPTGGVAFPGVAASAMTWIKPFVGSSALLKAQQSSIGGQLSNSTNTYIFPANYSGTVEIRIYLASTDAYNAAGWAGALGSWKVQCAGNVTPVTDIYQAGSQLRNSSIQATTTYTGQPLSSMLVYHVRVGIASNGVDNTFSFSTPFGDLVPPVTPPSGGTITAAGQVCQAATFEVSEYNPSLNYAQDGSNDAIVLVNQNTNVVTEWTG